MKFVVILSLALTIPIAAQEAAHEACAPCHSTQAEEWESHIHRDKNVSCSSCHGKSTEHANAAGAIAPEIVAGPTEQPKVCGACHTTEAKEFQASSHGKLIMARSREKQAPYCTTCHDNHAQRTWTGVLQQCNRCHEELPASCKQEPAAKTAKVECANCHEKHNLAAKK
jgi:hypothetical protein